MSSKQSKTKRGESRAKELGTETDAAAVRTPQGVSLPKVDPKQVDPKRLNTKADDSRSFERGALVSYFRDIAEIPTLQKEHEVLLAKEIESATHDFRHAILGIPWTGTEVVRVWQGLKQEGRATGKMSESFGSGSPDGEDLGARVDACLKKVEGLLRKRGAPGASDAALGRLAQRTSRL
ncbi:MAG: hypothetical protein ABFS46_15270, partial [Myxococcota bacterium]